MRKRMGYALGVWLLMALASVASVAAAGGNGATFCSEATVGFNPGFANRENQPLAGGLPQVIGQFAPVASSFCNPNGPLEDPQPEHGSPQ